MFGYLFLATAIAVHIGFWFRAKQLNGFWGHLNEAGRWMQTIDALSLLAFVLLLSGIGWKRWFGSCLALGSFILCCG